MSKCVPNPVDVWYKVGVRNTLFNNGDGQVCKAQMPIIALKSMCEFLVKGNVCDVVNDLSV